MAKTSYSLRSYVIRRLLLVIPMIWVVLTLVFLLLRVAPGNPVDAALGGHLPAAELAQRSKAAGFDRPLVVQYFDYLKGVVTGNFGTSITDDRTVTNIIAINGAATLELTIAALFVAIVVGVPIGLVCGYYRNRAFDVVARILATTSYAAPVFFLGLLAQLLFSQKLGWLPNSGDASPIVTATLPQPTHIPVLDALLAGNWSAVADTLRHLVLPACTLGLVVAGVFIRLVRINVIQTLRFDNVEAARARGVKEWRVVVSHAFRNALVPVTTVMGLQAALLLSGAVLTEETFNWPGIGYQLIQYINNRDYTAVQGIVTFFALVVVFVSLAIDMATVIVDPRAKYS